MIFLRFLHLFIKIKRRIEKNEIKQLISVNSDLLAVTYGELDLNVDKEGYVMFWSLINPSYPERIIKYPSRITCCKFS